MSEIPYPPASAVSRLIRIAISSFLSALLLCSVAWAQSPNAEDASGESVIEAQVDSGPYPLTVRVLPPDDVNREAPRLQVWVEEQSTAALDVEIPQFLVVQPSPPELRALWTEVRGGPGLLRLDISVVSSINRSIWSLVLVAPTRARGEFQYLWSGRHNEEGYGEYLTVEDLDGDDRDEVVTYVRDRQLPVCARPDVLLLPRVYDPRRDVFRPVSLRVDPSDDAQELVPVHESFPDHFSADSEWTAVSSDGSIPVTRNYGPVPDAIVDGDVSTSWIEGAAGAGVGQFFHGVVIDEVSLRGIWLHNGRYDGGVGPTRILIILGDGSEFTASLEPYGPHYLEFPEPIDGIDCLNLVVLDAPEEAESVEIAELHPVTELDMRPIERALTLMLLPLLYENQNTLREAVIADVIASGGPAIFDTLDEELLEASPEDQPALVGPYMRIRGGRDRLLERVSQLELESQTVAEIRRRLTGLDPEDSSTLVRYANEAVDDELRSQLLSVLARSVAPEQAIELASMAGIGSQADRDQVVDALARIPIEDIGEILAYLPAGATERNIDLL